MGMFIAYRRTGGVLALLAVAAVAVVGTVLTVVVGATVLVGVLAVAAVALVARAVLPASVWPSRVGPVTPWPQETIETTAVNPAREAGTAKD